MASSSACKRSPASTKSGGLRSREAMISGCVVPVPASRMLTVWRAVLWSCAPTVTRLYAASTACLYADGSGAAAAAVPGQATMNASDRSPIANAMRVFRDCSCCRLRCSQTLGMLKQVEGLSADAEVEVDENDRDLKDWDHKRVDDRGCGGKYPRGCVRGKDDLKKKLTEKDVTAKRQASHVHQDHDQEDDQERAPPPALHQAPASTHGRDQPGVLDKHNGHYHRPADPDPDPQGQQAKHHAHDRDEDHVSVKLKVPTQHPAYHTPCRRLTAERRLAGGVGDGSIQERNQKHVDE